MASAQTGKTEAALNTLGYFMHQDPSPIMMVQPTIEMAEAISKDRIATMLRDSPALSKLVRDRRVRDSGNEILHKVFPGGHLTLSGANSPASLASRPIRVLLFDEVDRFPPSAGSEGDPVNLAIKRSATFWNRVILKVSTPTIKGASRIEKDWERSDKRIYHIPCPHCQKLQPLVWERVQWEKDKNSDKVEAWYQCVSCFGKITDAHKPTFLAHGRWIVTNQGSSIAGFHLSELYSPWRSFAEVVKSYLEAKDDPQLLKVFWNTSLGLPFDDGGGEGLRWKALFNRREPYQALTVPRNALLLTAGVDVQANRLAVSVWGWGRGEEAWLIYHTEIYGNPSTEKVWQDLDSILEATYSHASGEMAISLTAIDTGFAAQSVYNYARTRSKVYPVKGSSTLWKPVISRPSHVDFNYKGKSIKKGVQIWPVGTDTAKSTIYARLKLPDVGPGYFHFPQNAEEEYFEQLTAEKCITSFVNGNPKRQWVTIRNRNEALDCLVYAYAAAVLAGIARINWDKLESQLFPVQEKEIPQESQDLSQKPLPQKKERSRRGSGFVKGW
jgi:phage terminase large subunit GpA-like protein